MSDIESGDDLGRFKADPDDDIKPIEITGDMPAKAAPDEKHPESLDIEGEASEQKAAVDYTDDNRNYIQKGDQIDLLQKDPGLKQIYVAAGWDHKAMEEDPVDIDLSCFLLDKNGQTRIDEDFVFYNNTNGADGAVKHMGDNRTGAGDGDDETIFLDLNGVPFDVMKIVFVLSVYDEELKGLHFGMTRNIFIRLVNRDDSTELVRLNIDDEIVDHKNVVQAWALVREGPRWVLEAMAEPVKGGHLAVAKSYGMIIKEDTG